MFLAERGIGRRPGRCLTQDPGRTLQLSLLSLKLFQPLSFFDCIFRGEAELHVGSHPSPATTRVRQRAYVVTCAATDPDATGD